MKNFSNINMLISSYWGMYAVQTVLHSFVASVLAECTFLAWDIKTPFVKQRFRFMIIFLPVILFPVYQIMSPHRGDIYFRLNSLFDSNRWFFLELWGGIPAFTVFAVILALTSLIFLIQELIPIVLHMLEQMRGGGEDSAEAVDEVMEEKVSRALEGLPFDNNLVEIINDEDLSLFSSTGMNPRIYISTGLIDSFSAEHLQAALAHEIGHIQRSRKPVFIFAYLLRVLMFFNPVAMIEFRKLVQEEENVCDDIAVKLTGNPKALSEAVDMLRPSPEDFTLSSRRKRIAEVASVLENYSHNVVLKSRILRIGQSHDDSWAAPYFITLALIIGINYFVV